jgi:hypothetical protein
MVRERQWCLFAGLSEAIKSERAMQKFFLALFGALAAWSV